MTQIPVNTRAVGDPKGSCLLYLEDYVHTFIRKIYQEQRPQGEYPLISLWGYEFEEQGRNYMVISGAIDQTLPAVSGERFFPSCYCIGQARILKGTDTQIGLEIMLPDNKKLMINDFYIYYDQNEEMQNYLIEWNLTHNKSKLRMQPEDAVRYTRMAQSYNREEARVSYLWNAVNLLSLGLMVCVAAFGIVSVNNYHKMKEMESRLSVVLSLPQETLEAASDKIYGLQTEIPDSKKTEETLIQTIEQSEEMSTAANETPTEAVWEQSETQITQEESMQQAAASVQQKTGENQQYYVVQQGDTLRSISMQVYGTYAMVSSICEWNGIEDADSILCGQRLLLRQE